MRYCFGCTSLARRRGKDKEKQNRKTATERPQQSSQTCKSQNACNCFSIKSGKTAQLFVLQFQSAPPHALKLLDMTGRREVRIVPSTFATLFLAALGSIAMLLVIAPLGASHQHAAMAQATAGTTLGASGLPVPRFVSLKPARVNLRVGPGRDYAVSWLFMKSGLPVEIIQEYDNWRRIRDADGTEGWVYQSLLSGKRTAITAPWLKNNEGSMITMHREPTDTSGLAAEIEQCDRHRPPM